MGKEEKQLLEEIHSCLIGNKLAGQEGLIDKVNALDTKVSKVENRLHSLENKKPIILKWLAILFTIKG